MVFFGSGLRALVAVAWGVTQAVLSACPLDDNPSRCGPSEACPAGFECYRGLCVPEAQAQSTPTMVDPPASEDRSEPESEGSQPQVDGLQLGVDSLHDAGPSEVVVLDTAVQLEGVLADSSDSKGASEPDAAPTPPVKGLPLEDASAAAQAPSDGGAPSLDSGASMSDTGVPAVELPPAPSAPGRVGDACEVGADCATARCSVATHGGYCTALCWDEGSTWQCPSESVCKRIKGFAHQCLRVCRRRTDCQAEARCTAVAWSTLWACVPSE